MAEDAERVTVAFVGAGRYVDWDEAETERRIKIHEVQMAYFRRDADWIRKVAEGPQPRLK